MKYVLTGAAGKVTRPLTKQLLAAGHTVTVLGRKEKNLEPLVQAGAKAAIGDVNDLSFLKSAFAGADAVYTMIPASNFIPDLKAFNENIGANYAAAIRENGIKHVVNLSSIGAHLTEGAGPISAIHYIQQALFGLKDVHVRSLRASYFYQNLLPLMDMVLHMKIIGGSFSIDEGKFPISHPDDVADAVAEELLSLNFSGHSFRYIASDETSTDEIASLIGKAVGIPGLQWMKFSDDQVFESFFKAGYPAHMAKEYVDMFSSLDSGRVTEDYWKNRPGKLGNIKIEQFAQQFAAIFQQKQKSLIA